MKKNLSDYHYNRLFTLYRKLNERLNRNFSTGRFLEFTKQQQARLLQRIERLKIQLARFESGLKYAGIVVGAAAGLALSPISAQAQFGPKGTEFQVNTSTTGNQDNVAVAKDSDGDFVVVWEDSPIQDPQRVAASSTVIKGQRYNASGVAQGSEFQVNTNSYTISSPAVAMDDAGDFVVTWVEGGNISAQRYNAAGVAQGSEFSVEDETGGNNTPSVAMDADGDFVITWQKNSFYVNAKRYNASGVVQGSGFKVNTNTGYIVNSSVAMDADGDFVVTWDGINSNVIARRFDAAGVAQGSEFQVSQIAAYYHRDPSVAMDSDGDFVITWRNYAYDGSYNIYAQRYSVAGVAQESEFKINSVTSSYLSNPFVAMDSNGDFVVSWDRDNSDVYAQRYNADGTTQGSDFLVNTYTIDNQRKSSIAIDDKGEFVVVWRSYGQDGDGNGVYAQIYGENIVTSVTDGTLAGSAVNLYPNPAKDNVYISTEGPAQVRILDLSGAVVKQAVVENNVLSLAGVQPGLYLVEISQNRTTTTKKLIVE